MEKEKKKSYDFNVRVRRKSIRQNKHQLANSQEGACNCIGGCNCSGTDCDCNP